jgi:hypothetical protein
MSDTATVHGRIIEFLERSKMLDVVGVWPSLSGRKGSLPFIKEFAEKS